MILAGDVGGTNFRLALFPDAGGAGEPAWRATYPSRGADWRALLARARRDSGASTLTGACVAVAGPVVDGAADLTNLGWSLSAPELAHELGLARAPLLNDLEAAAHGLAVLASSALHVLQRGEERTGHRVLCSPGTGLGQAAAVWDGRRHLPLASEGGHTTFAPLDDDDRALSDFLAERHGHVSQERVLSGPGLVALYEFHHRRDGLAESATLTKALAHGGGPAAITAAALAGEELARRTLLHFARLLGAEAANLALKFLAQGGVFLGGGIPPRILAFLDTPAFREGFLAKGRMRPLLARYPVRVVLDPDCALRGAAQHAAESRT
jgi:glucokinase